jgi:hypothetical protein
MSTDDGTAKSSAVSRKRAYVPGEAVTNSKRNGKRARQRPDFPEIPYDVLDKILTCILDTQVGGLSVIKLSMVNRAFRKGVNDNLPIWYRLYLQWRGPIRDRTRDIQTPRGVVRLRPTIPVSVPNFRTKSPPLT